MLAVAGEDHMMLRLLHATGFEQKELLRRKVAAKLFVESSAIHVCQAVSSPGWVVVPKHLLSARPIIQ